MENQELIKQVTEKAEKWLTPAYDAETQAEVKRMLENPDKTELIDSFYKDLEFGTGGLRGIMGAGTNRMNIYTVGAATQGLSNYLNKCFAGKKDISVVVGHDCRNNSDKFAKISADIFSANGIKVYLFDDLRPTPEVSFAIRHFGCQSGINITASHNPAKYNGYKVYGADGCQITLEVADKILAAIEKVDCFDCVKLVDYEAGMQAGRIVSIDDKCLDDFVQAVYDQRVGDGTGIEQLKLVYTPLNGTGLECVKKLLAKLGVTHVTVVPEQETPDGNFPTCPYPNPEIREAMQKGLELCDKVHPDLLLGTDPDCDRCGTAVPDGKGGYRLITGNEMGIILLDYICRTRLARGTMPKDPVAVTTIVSTDMATPVAKKYGVELRRTLTGFKFIGEQIGKLEAEGRVERYIFGFEESYGYLSGGHVRDKDAVNATLLVCEAAAWYAQQGMTLLDAIEALYKEFGYYRNALCSFAFEGETGMYTMQNLMKTLRADPPKEIAGYAVERVADYDTDGTGLPRANVLEYHLAGGHKLMVRPSGTEPKIKVYLSAVGKSEAEADAVNAELAKAAEMLMK
jgi:phosphoglucomutase